MAKLRVVLDTNIWVSALLLKKSVPFKVVEWMNNANSGFENQWGVRLMIGQWVMKELKREAVVLAAQIAQNFRN